MSRYRKVEVRTWGDQRFRNLSAPPPNGQTLWLYLLCGPRTTQIPGVVVARDAVLADDLGWSAEGLRKAFAEAFREGLVEVDPKAGLILLRKALLDGHGVPRESARPESPNVLRSWAKLWPEIPECPLKIELLQRLRTFAKALGPSFQQAFAEAFGKALAQASPHPSPNQEQEQEQEQEEEKSMRGVANGSTPVHVEHPEQISLSPVFIDLPLNTGKPWPVSETLVSEWEALFPRVDVRQALRTMRAWCDSKPSQRKTARGVKAFVTNWLARDQDSGRNPRDTNGHGKPANGNGAAVLAWNEVRRAIRDGKRPEAWTDPATATALEQIGGFSALREMRVEDAPHRQRDFQRAFDAVRH